MFWAFCPPRNPQRSRCISQMMTKGSLIARRLSHFIILFFARRLLFHHITPTVHLFFRDPLDHPPPNRSSFRRSTSSQMTRVGRFIIDGGQWLFHINNAGMRRKERKTGNKVVASFLGGVGGAAELFSVIFIRIFFFPLVLM